MTSAVPYAASWSSTRTDLLSRYIYGGTQGLVVGVNNDVRWYFQSPAAFARDNGAVYGGTMEFVIGAFQGDFTGASLYSLPFSFVELVCSTCNSGQGITLAQVIRDVCVYACGLIQCLRGALSTTAVVSLNIRLP